MDFNNVTQFSRLVFYVINPLVLSTNYPKHLKINTHIEIIVERDKNTMHNRRVTIL